MSRVVVKNLPQSGVDSKELAAYFSDIDTVTDVSLKYNDYGAFRRFAFVGFKTEEGAQRAIDRLNNTYFAKSKLSVELCKQIREVAPLKLEPKSAKGKRKQTDDDASRVNQDQEKATNSTEKKSKKIDPFKEVQDDPDFEEFYKLQRNVHDNATTKHIWSDDVPMDNITTNDGKNLVESGVQKPSTLEPVDAIENKPKKKRKRAKKKKVDKCKPKEIFQYTIKIKGFPPEIKRRDIKQFLTPLKPISLRLDKRDQLCYVSFKTDREMKIALKKDLQFYNTSRLKIVQCHVDKCKINKERQKEKVKQKEEQFEKYSELVADDVEESGRIFVRNLNYTCTEEDLEKAFSPYGDIAEIHLSIDEFTKLPKGFAFVEFVFPSNAAKAYQELNGTIFQGRNFHLLPAKPKPDPITDRPTVNNGGVAAASSFKAKKLEEQKAQASSGSNWNTLFLGQNAVVDVISERQQVDKASFLTDSSKKDPLPVRMALGDTVIVEETRNFLISQGVELDSFSNAQAPRSKNVILAKNLPARTDKRELMEVFSKHGLVSRVIIPRNGLTAIIEMQEPTESKLAFRNLAYTKFKNSLLYLEWAPINVFRTKSLDDQEKQEIEQMAKLQTGTKIVVKNIPFEATQSELTKIFKVFGELNFVRFIKKPDGHHRGFAFVDFCTKSDALRAFRALCHSTHLYGRKLVLEWAAVNQDLLQPNEENIDNSAKEQKQVKSAPRMLPKRTVFEEEMM